MSKQGKVAVVTGAAGGIGQVYARRLAEDMAGVVSFLTSDDASFVTAQVLVSDGGWVRL